MAQGPLSGLSILILEDEFLIAMDMEQHCRDAGALEIVVARALGDLGEARNRPFDAAVLDVRLGGESTFEFARELTAKGVPFLFATGYTDLDEMTLDFLHVPVLAKPYRGEELIDAVRKAAARGGGGA